MKQEPVIHSRARIYLKGQADAMKLVTELNKYTQDRFTLENFDGTRRVDAKSIIGVMYFMFDMYDDMFLVNDTHDGLIPSSVDVFRQTYSIE